MKAPLLQVLLSLALISGCGGTSNNGSIFDPNPPGTGGGGGGGGGIPKGPSAAPVQGGLTVTGPPTVLSVAPSGTNVSIEAPVCVTFNETVQAATVTPTTLALRIQLGTTILASITSFGGGRFFVLTPASPLPTNRTIEVIASTQIRDLEGNPLGVPTGGVIGSFTTEVSPDAQKTPVVIATFPPDGAKNVSPGIPNYGTGTGAIAGTPTPIVTVFSEPIAPSSILGNLTANPPIEGLSITQLFDPDGSGPLPPSVTVLLPGSGAILTPDPTNRIWSANPVAPLKPGATILHRVGTGVTNDDVTPTGIPFPGFTSQFTIAPLEPPNFVGIVTATGLSTTTTFLNNAPPPNPNYAGAFTVGVVFSASALSTDEVEIQLHDATSTGVVNFKKKTGANGAGETDYGSLSIFGPSGLPLLKDANVVLAARTKRGSIVSSWSVGPPVVLDAVVPTIVSFGPPSVGPVLLTPTRLVGVYGTATEAPARLDYTALESPTGTAIPIPTAASSKGLLLGASGNLFTSLPLVPSPPIPSPAPGTPPEEPTATATVTLSDAAGNTSTPVQVAIVARGRIGGPALAAQNALRVVVFDEDTLVGVSGATVLLDQGTPSGSSTGQLKRVATLNGSTGVVSADFAAPLDFPVSTPELTVTALAPGYDITTVIAVSQSFVSIPIRKTRGTAATNDPTLSVAANNAPAASKLDLAISARADVGDRWLVASIDGLVPTFAPTTVASNRLLFLASYVRASEAFPYTFLNDAYGYPAAPVALGGASSSSVTFGQSFSQTSDPTDDPVSVPPAGGVPVTLPALPFDSSAVSGSIEVGLFVPGIRMGLTGMLAIGDGRAGSVLAGSSTATTSFDPKVNSAGYFYETSSGSVVASPVNPNAINSDARIEVRAEDVNGNISRALVPPVTGLGPVLGIALPNIPQTQAPVASSGSGGLLAPKIRWTDTLTSIFVAQLTIKQTSPNRLWRVYVRRANADTSTFGFAAIQLPSLLGLSTAEVGAPLPTIASLVDQSVDAIQLESLDLYGFTDFFFDDLRFSSILGSSGVISTFARSRKVEIVY